MKILLPFLLSFFLLSFISKEKIHLQTRQRLLPDTLPGLIKGEFTDDYGIHYFISDSVWLQRPGIKYRIIRSNAKEQFLIARNGENNPSDAGLYTRIDYMPFSGMAPYLWGFCLTVYNAKTDSLAETTAVADRQNPRKGCNGFPFSRMKRTE